VQVLIISNSKSGRGRGAKAAAEARAWLESSAGGGHTVLEVAGGPGADQPRMEREAAGSGVIVVAGGDGSVHHAAPIAMRTGVPIYHLPCGNENLFAREFGMTRSPQDLSNAIAGGRVERVDIGRFRSGDATAKHFLLMASFGPDASVVHRLAASRTRATGHLAYAKPVAAEFWRPHLPQLSVWLDGKAVVEDQRGILVIANCRRYALGIDPCHRASMTDGKLNFAFLPCSGTAGVLRWGWCCRRRIAEARGAICGEGAEIVVRSDGGASQVDGEAADVVAGDIAFRAEASVVPCLMPVSDS